jgi:hypothetical protein
MCDLSVRVLDPPVALSPGQLVRQIAPEAVGPEPVAERQAVGRVAVLAVECGNANLALGEQGRVDELGDVPDHAVDGMNQGDQAVGRTAAVLGVEPEDEPISPPCRESRWQTALSSSFMPRIG